MIVTLDQYYLMMQTGLIMTACDVLKDKNAEQSLKESASLVLKIVNKDPSIMTSDQWAIILGEKQTKALDEYALRWVGDQKTPASVQALEDAQNVKVIGVSI